MNIIEPNLDFRTKFLPSDRCRRARHRPMARIKVTTSSSKPMETQKRRKLSFHLCVTSQSSQLACVCVCLCEHMCVSVCIYHCQIYSDFEDLSLQKCALVSPGPLVNVTTERHIWMCTLAKSVSQNFSRSANRHHHNPDPSSSSLIVYHRHHH